MEMAILDMDITGALVGENAGRGDNQPVWVRLRR